MATTINKFLYLDIVMPGYGRNGFSKVNQTVQRVADQVIETAAGKATRGDPSESCPRPGDGSSAMPSSGLQGGDFPPDILSAVHPGTGGPIFRHAVSRCCVTGWRTCRRCNQSLPNFRCCLSEIALCRESACTLLYI